MSDTQCGGMALLVQADIDGELDAADAARVAAHVAGCAPCAIVHAELLALSGQMRQHLPRYPAPGAARIAVRGGATGAMVVPVLPRRIRPFASFGAGFALAAGLALAYVLPRGASDTGVTAAAMVDAHIRALQPGHLIDVASTDQHTVKPWFDGRLPFAPPVKDEAALGFPLAGARLDYIGGTMAGALVYRRDKHLIDVFVWPGSGADASGMLNGYNYRRWTQGGMVFWAVSDLNARELGQLVSLLEKS